MIPNGSYTEGHTNTSAPRVQGDGLFARKHIGKPNNIVPPRGPGRGNRRLHFPGNVLRVRRPGAQHDLRTFLQMFDGVHQVNDPFLPGNAAHEQHERF